jgi:hypothetical protein
MFSRLRKVVLAHSEILSKLERIEQAGLKHDRQFEKARKKETEFDKRPGIGFKPTKFKSFTKFAG